MIELTPEHEKFISDQIEEGPFSDRGEVVRAALELLRQRLQTDYDATVESIKRGIRDYENGKDQTLAESCEDIRNSLGLGK